MVAETSVFTFSFTVVRVRGVSCAECRCREVMVRGGMGGVDDVPITPSREEWEEAREMGRVAGGSRSDAMDASSCSTRLSGIRMCGCKCVHEW